MRATVRQLLRLADVDVAPVAGSADVPRLQRGVLVTSQPRHAYIPPDAECPQETTPA